MSVCVCVSCASARCSTTVMRDPSELLRGFAVLCRALRQNEAVEKAAKESGADG